MVLRDCVRVHCVLLSGNGTYGELGYGNTEPIGVQPGSMSYSVDVDLGVNYSVDAIVLGQYHSCAISTHHVIKCWGYNDYGNLGIGSTEYIGDEAGEMGDSMIEVELGTNFVAKLLDCGGHHCCSLSTLSQIKCWGLYQLDLLHLHGLPFILASTH